MVLTLIALVGVGVVIGLVLLVVPGFEKDKGHEHEPPDDDVR